MYYELSVGSKVLLFYTSYGLFHVNFGYAMYANVYANKYNTSVDVMLTNLISLLHVMNIENCVRVSFKLEKWW